MKNLAVCYLYKENYEYGYEYATDLFRQALDIMEYGSVKSPNPRRDVAMLRLYIHTIFTTNSLTPTVLGHNGINRQI